MCCDASYMYSSLQILCFDDTAEATSRSSQA
uniref:Uncharacterized protein n=1 Tax=Arundo donax TaxID=35708 RepID=A0A0A9A570_ARUDO